MDFPTINEDVTVVQEALKGYMSGDMDRYVQVVHDDFFGCIMPGIVPGGESIQRKEGFVAFAGAMSDVIDVKKFVPSNWAGDGNGNVFFTVDWEFVHKPTGKTVTTTAVVRKVVRDGKIAEKYHMVDPTVVA